MAKEIVTLRIDSDLLQRVDARATEVKYRTRSAYIIELLEADLAKAAEPEKAKANG